MNRRHFIQTTGASLASLFITDCFSGLRASGGRPLLRPPDQISALAGGRTFRLSGKTDQWTFQDIMVRLSHTGSGIPVTIQASESSLEVVTLHWKLPETVSASVLNDHWERTYGNVSWHPPDGSEILPWYFLESDGRHTSGFGVKTGCRTFCFWQIDRDRLTLTLDTRSGGTGVRLGNRILDAAEIVTLTSQPGETPFETARRFTRVMCDRPRMPEAPVYGINDWYFSYGNTSEKLIIAHTEMLAPMADGFENRPFSVIDAGWFQGPPDVPDDCCWGDDMATPDRNFKDMGGLAEKIRKLGMRPGIWTRPLCGSAGDSRKRMLPLIQGRQPARPVLDPTLPENIERIRAYFRLYRQWTFEIVKIDFTTYDILGKWGFEMLRDRRMTEPGWQMADRSRTSAEIILNLYQEIRDAAGDTLLIGCNTISHLSAGLFEVNRIGDDTSGQEWDRTRRMGVNTLAFRGVHHGTFYAADGDCVGLTTAIPWEKNRQWMELVAKSGTPLFISAQPEAVGSVQKAVIRDCFQLASRILPVGEPLEWMENPFPGKWKLNGRVETFNWD